MGKPLTTHCTVCTMINYFIEKIVFPPHPMKNAKKQNAKMTHAAAPLFLLFFSPYDLILKTHKIKSHFELTSITKGTSLTFVEISI
jgi:hypothetical protein